MVIILVHWLIKKGHEHTTAFEEMWKRMRIDPTSGLFREILTRPVEAADAKFNTFSITDAAYVTYLNIGIWKDIQSFDNAVGQYIPTPELRKPRKGPFKGKEMLAVYQHPFEFKVRERIILEVLDDRKGADDLPPPSIVEAPIKQITRPRKRV